MMQGPIISPSEQHFTHYTTVEGYKCLVNVKLANDEEWPVSDVELQQFEKVFLSAATGRFRSSFVECIGHFLLEI